MTKINSPLEELFTNKVLFEKALTHRSWVNENPGSVGNNERLEFLGDAVLEFVVSAHLYEQFPEEEEGFLTALRANIVNTLNLAQLATALELGQLIKLSKGEELGKGRENESLLADTVEAIIGAIFIDSGLKNAEGFIFKYLLSDIADKLKEPLKDSKSRLQEMIQAEGSAAPRYVVTKESGPDHDKEFEIEVHANGEVLATGTGKSKSRAEQAAAEAALVKLSGK